MIVPRPANETPAAGAFPKQAATRVLVSPASAETRRIADMLAGALHAGTGIVPSVEAGEAAPDAIALSLTTDPAERGDFGAEGYRLEIAEDGVRLVAATPAGLLHGAQSLRQMADLAVSGGRGAMLPCTRIEDRPRYPWRGFMLDSSRHFQPVATIKRLLDAMAYLKLNVFHWHLTDSSGWRLEIRKYPRLTEVGARRGPDEPGGSGFYTQEEARSIVAYAGERGIIVVPEIEMPAHAAAAMAAYPELTCSGEPIKFGADGLAHFAPPHGDAIFCPSREETYTFIEGVLSEVMEVFDGPVIHLGGDERPEGIWSACPRCKEKMAREGLASESALQHAFMARVTDFVNARGRRTMAWMPTVEHGIPVNQIAEDWFFDLAPSITAQGHDVVNARDRFTYLDYPNFPGRQKPDWMPELTPERMYEFEPTPEGLTPEQAAHVIGAETSLWTEFVEEDDLATAIFPRMLAFAEVAWTQRERRDWTDFLARMSALRPSFEQMGFPFATPEREHGASTRVPARVTTSMEAEGPYRPECAFDGKFTRSFWSKEPPKAGDHLTITLDEPVNARRIALYTGSDIAPEDSLSDGVLEVSDDGRSFREVAPVRGARVEAELPGTPVKGIRVRVTADQERRLAIREVVIEP